MFLSRTDNNIKTKKRPKMSKDKSESFTDLAQSTTLHGLRFVAVAKSIFRKLFWTVCLFGAAAVCVLQTKESFDYYRSNPISTVIAVNKENKSVFPEVTICNLNSIHKEKYSKLVRRLFPNITDKEIEEDISHLPRSSRPLFDQDIETANVVQLNRTGPLNINNLTSISHGINDILLPKELLACTWAGKPCGAEHFKTFHFAKYIQCFTFKPPVPEVTPGYTNGLRLRMNVGAEWHLPNFLEPIVGLKVLVHPSGEYPQVDLFGFLIEPGIHTSCAVQRTQIINLGKPYPTNCGEKELKFVKKESYSYSRALCVQDCYYRVLMDRCHCKTIEMSGNLPLCLDEIQTNCNLELSVNISKVAGFSKCMTSCQESCKFSMYKAKLSTAKLHAKNMVNDFAAFCKMKNHKPSLCQDIRNKSHMEKIQFVRDNIVSLEVYLESDYYEEIKQVPAYVWFELMSDIGGNLGLFLGASILTWLEFVDYVIRILWCKLRMTVKSKSIEMKSRDSNTQAPSGLHDIS